MERSSRLNESRQPLCNTTNNRRRALRIESFPKHLGVYGLPASLLDREDHTVAVIALMRRKACLNREIRHAIKYELQIPAEWRARVARRLSKFDGRILACNLSPAVRFRTFWSCSGVFLCWERKMTV